MMLELRSNTDALKSMRLVIASHVTHFRHNGQLFGYGPYTQEIDLWADLFETVTIAGPCRDEAPPGDCLPFTRANIFIDPQIEVGGDTAAAKIKLALATPLLVLGLARAMWRADAIHVRCPGNLGLLGALVGPLFSRRLVAKFAAQWPTNESESLSSLTQKAVLKSRWWRGPVTVYGEWPDQPPHIIPFFTSLLTARHMELARQSAARPWNVPPLRVLHAGRLTTIKNVDFLLRAVAQNRREGLDVRVTVAGEGPEDKSLRALASSLGIADAVEFLGGVDFDRVLELLGCHHVLALASELEGWPKAIAEAMAFGLICIGSNRGFVPKMLADGRGLVVPPRNEDALAKVIGDVARDPHSYAAMRRNAAEWSQRFSIDDLQTAIRELLLREWKLGVPTTSVINRAVRDAR